MVMRVIEKEEMAKRGFAAEFNGWLSPPERRSV
jgi:hypothetical protein